VADQASDSLCELQNWLSEKKFVISVNDFHEGNGEIVVMCAELKSKVALKAYDII